MQQQIRCDALLDSVAHSEGLDRLQVAAQALTQGGHLDRFGIEHCYQPSVTLYGIIGISVLHAQPQTVCDLESSLFAASYA